LANHFTAEFKGKCKKDISENRSHLHAACEVAKHILPSITQASIEIGCLYEGIDFNTSITHAQFEELNVDLFHSTLDPEIKVLQDAKLDMIQFHDIVLVGV
jgi:heat shock protein 1/8